MATAFGKGTGSGAKNTDAEIEKLHAKIGKWLTWYNAERPHSRHGILTPDEACAMETAPRKLAA